MTSEGDKRTNELVRLLEADAERTSSFIEGVVGHGFTIRGWAITVALALVGFAFDRSQWELAAVGLGVTCVFGFVDVYHSWLYTKALEHRANLERILGAYYATLTQGVDDPAPAERFAVEADTLHYGLAANLERFTLGSWARVRPRPVLLGVYGVVAAIALAATLATAFGGGEEDSDKLSCSRVAGSPPGVYNCIEQ